MRATFTCTLAWILAALACAVPAALAQNPIGQVQATDARIRGSVVLANTGASVMSGAQVAAGSKAAVLKLERGGEVRICPGTSISVASNANGRDFLIGMSVGAIETHYSLGPSADAIVTPDYRVQLPGPGAFHFAFSANAHGDMCVQSLEGNTSSVIVSEQFGDSTHQVKPGEAFLFHVGRFRNASSEGAADCGCPAQAPAEQIVASELGLGFPEQESKRVAEAVAAGRLALPEARANGLPFAAKPGEVVTEVDAPFVFRGENLTAAIIPPVREDIRSIKFPDLKNVAAVPPPQPVKKKWYQRLGAAFAAIFH